MPSKSKKKTKKFKHTGKARHAELTAEQRAARRKRKLNKRRKEEIAKLLRKKSRQRGPNPYSAVRFHQGYVFDPVRYTVLTASQMSSEREEMVTSTLKTVTSGPEAMTLPEKPGWATHGIGFDGRVYIVSYLGTEVALFFKRQLTEVVPEPGEKVPEGVLQDPKEAWMRLDLLGRSAEKSHFVLTQQHRRLEEANRLLTSRVQTLDDLNDSLTYKLEDKESQITHLEDTKNALKRELAIARSKPRSKSKRASGTNVAAGKHTQHRVSKRDK